MDHLEDVLRADKVFFIDPIFAVGRERTLEMCRALRGRRFSYIVESRADVLVPSVIPALREAGVALIYFGVESASPSTLVRMDKVRSEAIAERYVTKAREVLAACFENDITPQLGFMLSFPGDTEADYRMSLRFAEEVGEIHDRVTRILHASA